MPPYSNTPPSARVAAVLPGLIFAVVAAMFSAAASDLGVSTTVVALGAGVVVGNVHLASQYLGPGLAVVRTSLLRAAIVLIGLRLGVGDLLAGGWEALVAVVGVVIVALAGTYRIARRFDLSGRLALLISCGFAICGASAVAAVAPLVRAEEEDVALAMATVALFGSLAVLALPPVSGWLGLDPAQAGWWAGASVHDVAQVVATAKLTGEGSLDAAVVTKMGRVLCLAPLLIGVARSAPVRAHNSGGGGSASRALPTFILLFLLTMAVSSTGLSPPRLTTAAGTLERTLLAMAMVGIGEAVSASRVRVAGLRAIGAGAAAWVALSLLTLPLAVLLR